MTELLQALTPVADVLERLGIGYHIGGSVASSTMGVMRTTLDVDLVADIRAGHAEQIARALSDAYYVDADMIEDAVRQQRSFNLIHLGTMFKIDVFVLKSRAFDQTAFTRAHLDTLPEGSRRFPFASAEDVVLNKLEWFRQGGEVSERQWNDIMGVLRVQSTLLDLEYLHHWAGELGVEDLLVRAVDESRLRIGD